MIQIIQEYNQKFFEMALKYDTTNTNIVRKIIHSYEVAKNCYAIAGHLGLNENQRNFCYLMGVMHDIGRLEQWKLYQTYNDRKSVDHGDLSVEILDTLDCEKLFFITTEQVRILKESIKYHTKPYLGDDKDIIFYNTILRNSDSYSNVFATANGMQQLAENYEDGVTDVFVEEFYKLKPLYDYVPKTKLDRCLMLCANCYYVKYRFLRYYFV
jgi:hypothetical protein